MSIELNSENVTNNYSVFNENKSMEEISSLSSNSNSSVNQYSGKLNRLYKDMISKSDEWFRQITFIKYKYNLYNKWNTLSHILIIFCSCTITFMEGLKNFADKDTKKKEFFSFVTLCLSFVIAMVTSVIKFFNIQGMMEKLTTVTSGLEHAYESVNKLISKTKIDMIIDNQNNEEILEYINNLKTEWIKITTEAIKDQNIINNLINPDNMSKYLLKFYKSEYKNNLILTSHNRHIIVLEKIENNISNIEQTLLEISDTNLQLDLSNNLKSILLNINNFGSQLKEYRKFINNNFTDSLEYTNKTRCIDSLC